MEPNAPLAYAPGTELHRPIMSTIGGHGVQLERERVTDINRSNQVFHLSTNVGSKTNHIQTMVPDYGKLWYDNKAISNIFLRTNFVNKYRVTYNSHQDYACAVHTNIWIIKFRGNKQGIYVFNPTYTTSNSNAVTTVEENMVGFKSRKIERAKLSRKIYINVGIPTVKNFNHIFSSTVVTTLEFDVVYMGLKTYIPCLFPLNLIIHILV